MQELQISVIKRNGSIVPYDLSRIEKAIHKALIATEEVPYEQILFMAKRTATLVERQLIKNHLNESEINLNIEEIQDAVENSLMQYELPKTAKAYILYRDNHAKLRQTRNESEFIKKIIEDYIGPVKDWRVKENSTVSMSLGGLILSNSGAVTANYWLNEVYDEDIKKAHSSGDMHIHDLSMLSGYCAGWSLKQLIQQGIGGVPGRITSAPAKHLHTLCNQMVNFLGIMQNEWAGAQAFSSFDTYLAPFVKKENLNYKQVKQCIQSFVYGINTPSRWGCVPMTTKIATPNGWKSYDELKIGDIIYTWLDGTLHEAPLKHLIHHNNDYGVLHRYKGVSYQQTVTPEHRCIIEGGSRNNFIIRQSMDIFNKRKDTRMPTSISDVDITSTNILSDKEVILAAMLYTDGTSNLDDISIYKSVRRDDGLIEQILTSLNIDYSRYDKKQANGVPYYQYHISSKHKDYIANLIGHKSMIDEKFMNMDNYQSKLFITTWASFNGSIKDRIMCQYDNEDIRECLEIIMLRAGYISHKWSRKKTNDKNPTNYLYADTKNTVVVSETEEIEYNGPVWCPNTNDGTAIYKDEDGFIFISGNCQAPFTNITLDWTCPNDMKNMPTIVGGKEQEFTYGDCAEEMAMVNKAFIEIMIEGDANGRGFQYPIPTYSITKDFDWSETENNRSLFEMTAKFGTPYFSNYINSDMEPSDVRAMCCRLRLDLRELRKKAGGYFGAGESTGSIGVVTLNLPRIAYLSKDENEFFVRLTRLMDIAARSLDVKRTIITRLLNEGLYPYTKAYLGGFDNHFSTIGLVGMNETCLNAKWIKTNIIDSKGHEFAERVLDFMRERLSEYQTLYQGTLFNLEATPAESTAYRLAKHDVKLYPNIITAASEGQTPYYTNSSQLPVGYTDDIFDALDLQDTLQTKYTSGTVFHAFLGERLPDWKSAATLVRKIAENYKLPYYTMSPTYSICEDHGYINGEVCTCPKCGKTTEIYSRITGYYRPIKNWNDGKIQEFNNRKVYDVENSKEPVANSCDEQKTTSAECEKTETKLEIKNPILVTTKICPNCKTAVDILNKADVKFEKVLAEDNLDLVNNFNIKSVPALIVPNKTLNTVGIYRTINDIQNFAKLLHMH